MGGRGGAGGGIGALRSAVEHSEFWKSAKSNAYLGAEKLLKSPTFVESVKEAIGKEAFMRDYDITQKQVDTLTNKMIRGIAEKKILRRAVPQRKKKAQKIMQSDILENIITPTGNNGKLHLPHISGRKIICKAL